MNIILFANHEMAIETQKDLIQKGFLKGVVVPTVQHESLVKVQTIAATHDIPVIRVDKNALRTTLIPWLEEKQPDAIFVITFSYIIPPAVLKIPKYGCFNWHTGVLPEYRGPEPVYWEMMSDEKAGGITLHRMSEGLDEGDIIKIATLPFERDQTHGEHYKKMEPLIFDLATYLIDMLVIDPTGIESTKQDTSKAKYYKDPQLKDLYICWATQTAEEVRRHTRATNPIYGGSRTILRGVTLHVFEVTLRPDINVNGAKPGTIVVSDKNNGIIVASKDGKAVSLGIIYSKEGFYSGRILAKNFNIQAGEEFKDYE